MTPTWFELDDKVLDSSQFAAPLIEISVNRGVNENKLLRGTGIFFEDIEQKQLKISTRQFMNLLDNALKQVRHHDLSFLLGHSVLSGSVSSGVASLFLNSKNLCDLERQAQLSQVLIFPLLHYHLERHSGRTYFIFSPSVLGREHFHFLLEMVFSTIQSMCKWRLGMSAPLHFYFPYARPKNAFDYEENLGPRLYFDQHLGMVSISDEWFYRPLPGSRIVFKQAQTICRSERKNLGFTGGILQFVTHHLRRYPHHSLNQVADAMSISPATLKRKLKIHGTSFQQLQDHYRSQEAVFDLCVRGLDNQNVAQKLHFSDLTNFRRSLKRWTGLTPTELRNA